MEQLEQDRHVRVIHLQKSISIDGKNIGNFPRDSVRTFGSYDGEEDLNFIEPVIFGTRVLDCDPPSDGKRLTIMRLAANSSNLVSV